MKKRTFYSTNAYLVIATLVMVITLITTIHSASAQNSSKTKNIVIVHGAFADASGWEPVFNILKNKGYNVTLVQNPLSSLEDDVDATTKIIDRQDGPVVLVGHSWGGTVITQAGAAEKVVSLVYVAAFAPAVGETTSQLASTAPSDKDNGALPPDANGIIYYDKAKFHAGFCACVSREKADFMFASQGPIAAKCFTTAVTHAAWQTKPSYSIVAKQDKSINPIIERNMYKRAKSKVTELEGSHVIFMCQPKEVAAVIEAAAKGG